MGEQSRPVSFAKTTRPSLAGVLARERLFGILDQRDRNAVVWVTGPPGSGKTTLVASYLEQRRTDSRWYQLDKGDSNVATFFYYMAQSAESDPLPLFTSEYHADLSGFTRRYFQTLFGGLKPPFVLVLDNYQEVSPQSAFHRVVLDAVAELPPEGCIVVVSRTPPPPEMVRLRANRALQQMTWEDLRLTRSESDAIVDLWGKALAEPARAGLYRRTEGWAAGLVLLLEHSADSGNIDLLPNTNAPEVVFDYLAGEIFDTFDERTRRSLLQTAFVPELTEPMAESLTGDDKVGEVFAALHRSHHFVSLKPGGSGPVYQFHPLLGDFLRARATRTLPAEQRRALRRQTALLLEVEGNLEDALALLRSDEDFAELKRLVLDHAADMLAHGRAETLEQWLDELPDEILDSDPWCYYWKAACRFSSASRESRLLYERAFAGFVANRSEDRRGLLLCCAGAMDAIIYELDDLSLLDRWIAEGQTLLEVSAGDEYLEMEARAAVSLFIAIVFRQPQHADMRHWAERAWQSLPVLEDINARMSAQLLIAITLNYTGQFARARELVDHMRGICQAPNVTPLALTVLKDVESMYYMLTADYERCLSAVYDGVEIGQKAGVNLWHYHLLSNGVAGALGAGELDTAEELLAEMHEHQDGGRRLDRCGYHYYRAWLAMLRGETMQAHGEQKIALRLAVETGCPFYEVLARLGLALILVELDDEQRAASNLRRVRTLARTIDNRLLEFMCLTTYAHIALEHGRERSGRNALRYAFGLGREHGFMHFPWWLPQTMASLCVHALEAGIEVDYTKNLINTRALMPESPPLAVQEWPWPLRIRTFGDFYVQKDDQPVGVVAKPQQKPIELLKALVALGPDNVPEATLTKALWPRIDFEFAHRSLSTTLHRLRKLLAQDHAIVLKHGRLSIDTTRCWLDVNALRQVFREIDDAFAQSPVPPSDESVAALAERLFAIYRGPFMAGEDDDARYGPARERLRNEVLRYASQLAHHWEESGRWLQAARLYERGIQADGLAEGLYRRLMLCYRELGRHAEALDVYGTCRRTILAERDAEPSPETTAIYQSVLDALKDAPPQASGTGGADAAC
jgi:ATP/maltotriose-dependent transcriptional regulator MalT/DNA-binding SARP family transcriptional activator